MSVNLPKDPLSVDSSKVPPQANLNSSLQAESSSAVDKDTLEAASGDEVSTLLTASVQTSAPALKAPQTSDLSIVGAFRAWSEAARAYRNELGASDIANLEARSKFSALAAAQANELSETIAAKEAAINKLMEELQGKIDELNQKLKEMEQLANDQQGAIDSINAGNGKEQQEYSKLVRAYDDYVKNMQDLGAVDLGNGKFAPPEEPPEAVENFNFEKFNQYTTNYQQAVSNFNQYWKGRSADIDKYNKTASAYDQKVAEYNKAINDFIKENNLIDLVNNGKITVPQLALSPKRSLDGYQSQLGSPPNNCEPPSYARSIAQGGPSALPKLPSLDLSKFDTGALKEQMYNNAYDSKIAPFDQAIAQCNIFSAFINTALEGMDKSLSSDSILNSKALANKLLSVKPTVSQASGGSLAMQTMGLDDSNMQAVMGALLIKEAIAQTNIKAFDKLSQEKKEAKIDQLTNKLVLLSVGLVSNESLRSLMPSLGIMSDILPSLPKTSPAYALLFAVSFSNRVGEDVKQGTSRGALQDFLNSVPEFAALPAEDKAKLVASISTSLNIGHLLIASKLLEDGLGLQGLLAQILPGLSPALNPSIMITQAKKEDMQEQLKLQGNIKEQFIEKGYSEDKAQFFGQVGTELTQNGLLTPNLTANISEKSVNKPLLEKSITAELALSPQYSLENAQSIAQEAISRTFEEEPNLSANKFRSTLETHLTDLGVKNSSEVAGMAVVIPQAEKSLASPTPLPTLSSPQTGMEPSRTDRPSPTSTVSESPRAAPASSTQSVSESVRTTPASPAQKGAEPMQNSAEVPISRSNIPQSPILPLPELTAIVEKRALQLLTPQLGPQLARQVSQEITKTFFDIKSPYSVINVLSEQLYTLKIENHENWANAVHETFTDTIKTMTSFPAFSRKVQDPSYKYVLASSIIHDEPGRKKAIDIPI